jgi:hypothetical protein
VLEEAEEAIEIPNENQEEVILNEIVFPEEQIDIIPVKRRKTKRQKVRVNPPGKKGTKRKLPENVIIEENIETVI